MREKIIRLRSSVAKLLDREMFLREFSKRKNVDVTWIDEDDARRLHRMYSSDKYRFKCVHLLSKDADTFDRRIFRVKKTMRCNGFKMLLFAGDSRVYEAVFYAKKSEPMQKSKSSVRMKRDGSSSKRSSPKRLTRFEKQIVIVWREQSKARRRK